MSGAVLAVVAVVVVGTLVALGPATGPADEPPDRGVVDPADGTDGASTGPVDVGAAFAIGRTVYLDGGRVSATVADPAQRSVQLSSAGLVVQGYVPDGEARVSLVGPDGTVRVLDVPDTALSTDADEPLVAWTEEVDGVVTAVALDVTTGERIAEVALPDHGGGFAPATLDGGHVYVGDGDRSWDVDLGTGDVTRSDVVAYVDEVAGGRTNAGYDGKVRLLDVETGEVLVEVDAPKRAAGSYFNLSPDGRYAQLADQEDGPTAATIQVYDATSGTSVPLPNVPYYGYGWTADGELTAVDRTGVLSVCSPTTGQCETTPLDLAVRPYQYADLDCSGRFVRGCVPTTDGTGEDYRDDLVLAGGGGWS